MSAKSVWIFLFSAATAKRFGESGADIRTITTDVMEDLHYVDQLKDDGQLVSGPQAAAKATGEIDPEQRLEDVRALQQKAKEAPEAVPLSLVKQALKDSSDWVRREAAGVLRTMGKKAAPAVPDLQHALKDSVNMVRVSAMYALGDIGKEAAPAIPQLKDFLKSSEKLSTGAGYALGRIGREVPDLVLPYLRQVLQGRHVAYEFGKWGYAEAASVEALGIMGLAASEAIPELRMVLKEGFREARRGAAEALKVMGPEATSAIPELREALFDIYYEVCVAAAETLGSMGKKAKEAVPSLAKAIHYFRFEHKTTWEKDRVYHQLESPLSIVRAAAKALSAMGEEAAPAIPELREVATYKDKYLYIKREAGKALQAIGEAARRNSKCCCVDRQCRPYEMGSTGLNAVDHSLPGLDRPEKGRCCKVYTGKCTRGYKSLLLKKAPEEQPDFQACEVSSELGASMTDAN